MNWSRHPACSEGAVDGWQDSAAPRWRSEHFFHSSLPRFHLIKPLTQHADFGEQCFILSFDDFILTSSICNAARITNR